MLVLCFVSQITTAKVLQRDAIEYLQYAQTLPEWHNSSSSTSTSTNSSSGELSEVCGPRKTTTQNSYSSASADEDSQELARDKVAALGIADGDFADHLFSHPPSEPVG